MSFSTVKIQSSMISHVDYDPATKELRATFPTGDRWIYFGVDEDVVDGLRTNESAGKYFQRHIRDVCQSKRLDGREDRN